jgi:hypothetical protein
MRARHSRPVVVPDVGIGPSSVGRRLGRITENLENPTLVADQSDGVPLVCVDPDVPRAVKDNAVTALENRMSNNPIARAEGIGRKRFIPARRAFECAR